MSRRAERALLAFAREIEDAICSFAPLPPERDNGVCVYREPASLGGPGGGEIMYCSLCSEVCERHHGSIPNACPRNEVYDA